MNVMNVCKIKRNCPRNWIEWKRGWVKKKRNVGSDSGTWIANTAARKGAILLNFANSLPEIMIIGNPAVCAEKRTNFSSRKMLLFYVCRGSSSKFKYYGSGFSVTQPALLGHPQHACAAIVPHRFLGFPRILQQQNHGKFSCVLSRKYTVADLSVDRVYFPLKETYMAWYQARKMTV
jgi:hypothetical protein